MKTCPMCGSRTFVVGTQDQPLLAPKSVVLRELETHTCTNCDEVFIAFPALGRLLDSLADFVAAKTAPLSADERAFLQRHREQSSADRER